MIKMTGVAILFGPTACNTISKKDKKNFYITGWLKKNHNQNNYSVAVIDLETGIPFFIPQQHYIHSILATPKDPNIVMALGKGAKHFSLIDLNTRQVLKTISSPEGTVLGGHGCIDDNNQAYVSAWKMSSTASNGIILKVNLDTGTIINQFPSYGCSPHELLITDDRQLLVLNSGEGFKNSKGVKFKCQKQDGFSVLSQICLKDLGKLKQKITFNSKEGHVAGHMINSGNGHVFFGYRNFEQDKKNGDRQPSGFYLDKSLNVQLFKAPPTKGKTFLSLATDKTNNLVIATEPTLDKVSIFDSNNHTLLDEVGFEYPQSIVKSSTSDQYYICGAKGLAKLNLKTKKINYIYSINPNYKKLVDHEFLFKNKTASDICGSHAIII